jgi:hypothetical protein
MTQAGERHAKSHPKDPKRTGSPCDDGGGGRGDDKIQSSGGGTVPDPNVRIPPVTGDRGGDS